MLWVLSVVQPDLLCMPEGPCGRGEASVEAGARESWRWQYQRGSLEWDGERETSGQIPAAEEHVKCEKLRTRLVKIFLERSCFSGRLKINFG